MVSGQSGQAGPHVTSRVAMGDNCGQDDVQIQCPRKKERIVLEKVYRVNNVQTKAVQVKNNR
jgi:hypothetical protein